MSEGFVVCFPSTLTGIPLGRQKGSCVELSGWCANYVSIIQQIGSCFTGPGLYRVSPRQFPFPHSRTLCTTLFSAVGGVAQFANRDHYYSL